jgi:hypothetical protein
MASSALNCGLRAWLARKGFPEDADVRKSEQLAGSITHGMVMLPHILLRRPIQPGIFPHAGITQDPEKNLDAQESATQVILSDNEKAAVEHAYGLQEFLDGSIEKSPATAAVYALARMHPLTCLFENEELFLDNLRQSMQSPAAQALFEESLIVPDADIFDEFELPR